MDEATAFTDQENEEKIQQSIAALTKGKTLLVIAHRLSTVRGADEIAFIDQEGIREIGTHEELMQKDGEYAALCKAQATLQSAGLDGAFPSDSGE